MFVVCFLSNGRSEVSITMSKLLSFLLLATVTISAYSDVGQDEVGDKGCGGTSSKWTVVKALREKVAYLEWTVV